MNTLFRLLAFRACSPSGAAPGFYSSNDGKIVNQTRVLAEIQDGLDLYNEEPSELVARLSFLVTKDKRRIAQGALVFGEETEGALPPLQRIIYRNLLFPMKVWDVATGWTKTGLEDATEDEIKNTANAALIGDANKVNARMATAIFVPRASGSAANETGYEASFWNGENDIPDNGEITFTGTPHYHYKGTGTTTFSVSMIDECIEDLHEHGFNGPYIAIFNIAQVSDVRDTLEGSGVAVTPLRAQLIDRGVHSGFSFGGVDYIFVNWAPAGYFAVLSTDVQALGRREHEDADARGLQIYQKNRNDTAPLLDTMWRHRYDFRVAQQGAGTVRQLTGSSTYTPPTLKN